MLILLLVSPNLKAGGKTKLGNLGSLFFPTFRDSKMTLETDADDFSKSCSRNSRFEAIDR